MSLDIEDFINLIIKAVEEREKAKAWDMWISKYQHMTEKTFIPFSKFYQHQKTPKISNRPAEDILSEAKAIRAKLGGGHHRTV